MLDFFVILHYQNLGFVSHEKLGCAAFFSVTTLPLTPVSFHVFLLITEILTKRDHFGNIWLKMCDVALSSSRATEQEIITLLLLRLNQFDIEEHHELNGSEENFFLPCREELDVDFSDLWVNQDVHQGQDVEAEVFLLQARLDARVMPDVEALGLWVTAGLAGFGVVRAAIGGLDHGESTFLVSLPDRLEVNEALPDGGIGLLFEPHIPVDGGKLHPELRFLHVRAVLLEDIGR